MEKQIKLFVRNATSSDIGEAMLFQSIEAYQEFGKEVLNRDFKIVPTNKPLPDIRDYISNGELDRDAYHGDVLRIYNANPDVDIFSLDIVDSKIMTEFYGQVYATSCQHFDSDTSENLTQNHNSVILSTNPLFLRDDYRTAGARAYLLTWHENGHLVYGEEEDSCTNENCIMSHPRDLRGSLEKKVKKILVDGVLPLCSDCNVKYKDFENDKNETKKV